MTTAATIKMTESNNKVSNLKGASRKRDCKRYAELCLATLNSTGDEWVLEENNYCKVWHTFVLKYVGEFNYLSAKKIANIYNLMEMVHGSVYVATYDRHDSGDEGLCITLEFSKDITDF